MRKSAKTPLVIAYADTETTHIKDLESKGVFVEIVGNEVRDQFGNIPEVEIKCCGIIVTFPDGREDLELMVHSVWEFLHVLIEYKVDRCYFHNLKFDDSFIASAMRDDEHEINGWVARSSRRMINDMGAVYSDTIEFTGPRDPVSHRPMKHVCDMWDSAKIWAGKLDDIGKSFGIRKIGGGIALRVGCDEVMEEYCMQDCRVMQKAMEYYFERCREETDGAKPYGWMTAASTSYNLCMMHIKGNMTVKDFIKSFPPCDAQHGFPDWLREGYKGAVPLLDPEIRGKHLKDVKVADINSQYPDKIRNYPMPIGYPIPIKEKTIERLMELKSEGKLWVAKVKLIMDVKKGHRATYLLKRKGNNDDTLCWHVNDMDGMYDGGCDFQVITSADMDYILRDYDVKYVEVLDCVGFKSDDRHVIAPFIDMWYERKEEASKNKDKSMKAFAKLILNSLYGKFGANPEHRSSVYTYTENMIRVKETEDVEVDRKPLYLPIAMFTTAYARDVISKTCNEVGWEHVAYTDTDSVHVHGLSNEEFLERIQKAGYKIDPVELGAYDYESRWGDAVYVRNKGYFHFNGMNPWTGEPNGEMEIKMAGANGFEGFNSIEDVLDKELYGTQMRGYRVKGGILLMEKQVSIDTRIDAVMKKKVTHKGMSRKKSTQEYEKRMKEIMVSFA